MACVTLCLQWPKVEVLLLLTHSTVTGNALPATDKASPNLCALFPCLVPLQHEPSPASLEAEQHTKLIIHFCKGPGTAETLKVQVRGLALWDGMPYQRDRCEAIGVGTMTAKP